ncbi:glutamine--fructose-6-phosphate transaminase (isomerizing) [Mesobacillus maritimus]|uniref:Glutamine--fructose-6-phosphate aminotransferase [isomerizing] n=1 Tax=Mesobacillus maritimus TaxID=1643336 RepID=A0ABS7K4U5_9BACI|nr:glutamine--fructose-6-phosphate transaminase (isomerizing) [Mesobacillus maritimus]MBY0097288.1 glutamine--fructose-6-phosphate transaminase (isomerizing) [Mesobacillus maritimus]
MCGIVGYIGHEDAKEILVKGLEKLEYRGYDSAGIALMNNEGLQIFKEKGRIAALRACINQDVMADIGIGHTRWATHGQPSRTNAHPHQSSSGRFTIVHNGIIENYEEIKKTYLPDVEHVSDTDTEVIAHLMDRFVKDGLDTEPAFLETLKIVKGSYALALLDQENTEAIYIAKNKSPLLIGIGEGFHVVSSDAIAMLQVTDQFIELMDKEIAVLKQDSLSIKNLQGENITRSPYRTELDASDIEKGTYPHYMLKEIDEQPLVIRTILSKYQNEFGELSIDEKIRSSVIGADRIYMIACGTSYHAGLVGKQLIEKYSQIPVEVHVASEFLYNLPLLSKNPLFIFISQSGETADCRGVLVEMKKLGHRTLTITNVPSSTLSREADFTLYTYAGPEIAVASTKAYTAQMAVFALLACDIGKLKGLDNDFNPLKELSLAANAMEVIVNQKEKIENLVWEFLGMTRNAFYIGRGLDYFVCLEGALKLKEISYIQAEGFAGGELKHGTIALIEDRTPVIALVTQQHVSASIRSNAKEVIARGANVLTISMEGINNESDQFTVPEVHEHLTPLVSVVPLQLLAYYATLHRGYDVDKPRNLAKSVTVE